MAKGWRHKPETIARLREINTGRLVSDETKRKLSVSSKRQGFRNSLSPDERRIYNKLRRVVSREEALREYVR